MRPQIKNKKTFNNVNEALSDLIKKQYQKKLKQEAKKRFTRMMFQQQMNESPTLTSLNFAGSQIQKAERRIRLSGNTWQRAEQMELWGLSLNEVPFLHKVEQERIRLSDPTQTMWLAEASARRVVTPSNSRINLQEWFDVKSLPD